ncbi:amino acid adenylation domain-containing protein [Kitasatospora sp. NPDC088779]|uniref:amino acid adenylation domain-containing protein n=1 Tax=Kitasatospora sp. NPDC088779 TaxID=3154964 RepID=UPI003440E5CC
MSTLTDLLATVADRAPDTPAVRDGHTTVTYHRLHERSEALARALTAAGAAGAPVLLALPPGAAWVSALLGCWRAAAAAVPLSPTHPPARLARLAEGVRATIAITPGGRPPDWAPAVTAIGAEPVPVPDAGPGGPPPAVADTATGCLFHTSGTTGIPKPVIVSHRALADRAHGMPNVAGITSGERIAQLTSPAFDAILWEVLCALATGATLHIAPPEARVPGPALTRFLAQERITALTCTPSQLAATPAAPMPDLRLVVLGGEALHPAPLAAWFTPGRRLANAYGPTETTVEALFAPDIQPGQEPVPIGRPLPGVHALVLDADRRPVPDSEAGELHLAGTGLTGGYLHRPQESAAAYLTLTHPDTGRPVRAYRTGDLVRRLPDGQYTFCGRTDAQLNLHGVRLEPDEIEACATRLAGVRAAAAQLDPAGERLVLFAETTHQVTPEALRRHLAAHLPPAAVPALITCRPALPRTATGKLDRRALATGAPTERADPKKSGTVLPEPLASWWHEACGTPAHQEDSFYAAGGDSLRALHLLARLNEHYDTNLSIGDFTADPTATHLLRTVTEPGRIPNAVVKRDG